MKTIHHAVINTGLGGITLSILRHPIISIELLIIILAGILIDIDHLFVEILKGTIRYPKKVIKYWASIPNKHTGELHIFHSYEFLSIVLFLWFFNSIFLFIFLGLFLHFLADGITNYRNAKSFKWLRDYSIILRLRLIKK